MQQTQDRKPFQCRLFQPPIETPTFATMPLEVKQKTIELMSRLLRQHWERRCVNSQKLQYAMQERLCGLGFQDIEVIDEDLG